MVSARLMSLICIVVTCLALSGGGAAAQPPATPPGAGPAEQPVTSQSADAPSAGTDAGQADNLSPSRPLTAATPGAGAHAASIDALTLSPETPGARPADDPAGSPGAGASRFPEAGGPAGGGVRLIPEPAAGRRAEACGLPAPTVIAPAGGAQLDTLVPELKWTATGTEYYYVEIATVADFSSISQAGLWAGLVGAPVVVRSYLNLAPNTTYYWRVASGCIDYSHGAPSAAATFRTGNIGGPFPAAPAMYAPAGGATVANPVTFTWGGSAGAIAPQIRFYASYEDAQSGRFNSAWWWDSWPSSGIITLAPGVHYWRLLARNDQGWGQPGAIRSFTVEAPRITAVEINQAIGRQEGTPVFVAGKETVVRAQLSVPVPIAPATQWVTVRRDGTEVTRLKPVLAGTRTANVLTFGCGTLAQCGQWSAGSYTFDLSIDGVTASRTATFQATRSIRVLAVPVRVKERGQVRSPGPEWQTAGEFVRTVYPIASYSGLNWVWSGEMDATDLDLTTSGGRGKLQDRLNALQPPGCPVVALWGECYDRIVGFLPPMPIRIDDPCMQECKSMLGWTTPWSRTVIVMANGWLDSPCGKPSRYIDNVQTVVAHELGHTFSLGEEYNHRFAKYNCDANPAPAAYQGQNWNNFLTWFSCGTFSCGDGGVQAWPDPERATGSVVSAAGAHPYEVGRRGALTADTLSFMGSGGLWQSQYWITPKAYRYLFGQLAVQNAAAAAPAENAKIIRLAGWIGQDDGIEVQPGYTVDAPAPLATVPGTYTAQAVDGGGSVLAAQGFEVSFVGLSDPPATLDPAPFEVWLPAPEGTSAFRILHGAKQLAGIPVTSGMPAATITAPAAGQTVAGVYTVQWSASDPDGGALSHTLQYSADGVTWITLAGGIEGNGQAVDFDRLGGGEAPRLRLLTTDGVNTASTTGPAFRVAAKAPAVFIYTPAAGSLLGPGDTVTLRGEAYDLQEGWLTSEAALTWSSDRDGELGVGSTLAVEGLSRGRHKITLTAQNGAGATASESVAVMVGERAYVPLVQKR